MSHARMLGRICLTVLCLAGFLASQGQAATLNFSGQLDLIDTNTGAGRYAAVPLGRMFSGSFSYGTLAEATIDPLFPGDYDFSIPPFGGYITDGTTLTGGSTGEVVQVTVADDTLLDTAAADLLNAVLGTLQPVTRWISRTSMACSCSPAVAVSCSASASSCSTV